MADIDRVRRPEERVVQVAAPQTAVPAETTDGAKAGPSIAVLPFANMSGDAEQEYFADGMVEEIITGLSRIRWLTVIARNSSFAFKGTSPDVRAVGRELNVRYVLEGSVRKAGERVRITGQLIEAETGGHLWADKFDGTLADVFDLQDQITSAVVGAIEPNVRKAEIERAQRKRPDSLDAYDLYLRAMAQAQLYTGEGGDAALDLLDRALTLNPGYLEAHGLAAWCHWRKFAFDGEQGHKDPMSRHASVVADGMSEDAATLSYASMALVYGTRDYAKALGLIDRALAISPNSAEAIGQGALINMFSGHYEPAIALARRALRINPLDPFRHRALGAITVASFMTGDYAAAEATSRQALLGNPRHLPARLWLISSLVKQGRIEDAHAAVQELLTIQPNFRVSWWLDSVPLQAAARDATAETLRAAGLTE